MKFYTITTEDTMKATYPGATLYPCVDCGLRVCLAADLEPEPFCPTPIHCCPKCAAANTADRAAQAEHWAAYRKAVTA